MLGKAKAGRCRAKQSSAGRCRAKASRREAACGLAMHSPAKAGQCQALRCKGKAMLDAEGHSTAMAK